MSTFKADYIIARQEEIAGNTSSIPVKTVVNGTSKAWVNFNGTGTIAIRANFNVASLTDNAVGDYTLNFSNAIADANYAVGGSCNLIQAFNISSTASPTTTACRIGAGNPNNQALADASIYTASINR